ncbi:transposase [Rhodococcus opacus RKJ300 = JCM 13270]|uniref:Transposase n=1 Tax=Rhodococcus opacus RKJ300 = JCM 13270 TaxID=1165867 RepID=I0WDG2_RHOOP|nr:transposase [Rhodococcus opacus RKJ300 = JCM 13270]
MVTGSCEKVTRAIRWRIERDYRELETGLGLDHYGEPTWLDRHHHATLVTAAAHLLPPCD